MVELNLAFPPTVNTYCTCVNNRKILSKKGKDYKRLVIMEAFVQGATKKTLTGRIQMIMNFCPPDKRRRDLSNHVKAVEDAIVEAGVIEDDSLIDYMHLRRGAVDTEHPRVEIQILEIE